MAESTVRVMFLGDAAGLSAATKKGEASFGALGRAAKLAGTVMAAGLGIAVVESVKLAVQFQKSMTMIQTQAGASAAEVKKLSGEVLKLAPKVGTGPDALAQGLFHLESQGLRSAKAMDALKIAAEGAKVGNANLEDVTNALGAVMVSGIKGAGDLNNVMGELNATVGAGDMRMQDLADALGTGLAAKAKVAGVSIRDISSALAVFGDNNIRGAQAGTLLGSTIRIMAAPSGAAAKALKSVGISATELADDIRNRGLVAAIQDLKSHLESAGLTASEQARVLTQAFGGRQSTGVQILVGQLERLKTKEQEVADGGNKFGAAWKATTDTLKFQLDKTKASLEAAAIPIGNLLLPALGAAAGKVADFAGAVQAHMPEIKAAFGDISSAIGDVGSKLAGLATSPTGMSAIGAIAAGGLTAKGIVGVSGAIAGLGSMLGRLGPWGLAASAAIGLITFAFIRSRFQVNEFDDAVKKIQSTLSGTQSAVAQHTAAVNQLSQAHLNVKTSGEQLRAAEQALGALWRAGKVGTDEYTKAQDVLTQAKINSRVASAELKAAEQNEGNTRKAQTKAISDQKDAFAALDKKSADLSGRYDRLIAQNKTLAQGGSVVSQQQRTYNKELMAGLVDNYASSISKLRGALGLSGVSARDVSKAVHEIANQIHGIPPLKEVLVRLRVQQLFVTIWDTIRRTTTQVTKPLAGRAGGGFVPGSSPGAPTLILAHAGEVVLNQQQQEALGGQQAIASMFGFTGQEGPGFASGGIVRSRKSPHHSPKYTKPLRRATAAVNRVNAALSAIADVIQRTDRSYGQQVREDDITQEQFLVDVPDGKGGTVTVLDKDAVAQRLKEIAGLVGMRGDMLALLDEKKADLDEAVKDMTIAIAAVKKAIEEEQKAIAADTKEIKELNDDIKKRQARVDDDRKEIREQNKAIADLRDKESGARKRLAAERAKKKPDKAVEARIVAEIAGYENQIDSRDDRKKVLSDDVATQIIGERKDRNRISAVTADREKHTRILGQLRTELKDWQSGLADDQKARLDWPLDRRDVELDVETLNYEASQIRAIKAPEPQPDQTGGETGGGGGGDTGGAGGGDTGHTPQQQWQQQNQGIIIEQLKAYIAQLQQALAIGAAQQGVIAAFQRGTLNVPVTGNYQLHAGEQVTPAGIVRHPMPPYRIGGDGSPGGEWVYGGGSGGGRQGPMHITLVVEGNEGTLKDFVSLRAAEVYDERGRRVDYYLREGRR
jgi:TP901 family phage tail tape measure protein